MNGRGSRVVWLVNMRDLKYLTSLLFRYSESFVNWIRNDRMSSVVVVDYFLLNSIKCHIARREWDGQWVETLQNVRCIDTVVYSVFMIVCHNSNSSSLNSIPTPFISPPSDVFTTCTNLHELAITRPYSIDYKMIILAARAIEQCRSLDFMCHMNHCVMCVYEVTFFTRRFVSSHTHIQRKQTHIRSTLSIFFHEII